MRGGEYVGGAPGLGLLLGVVLLEEGVGGAVARAERARRVERDGEPGRRAGDGGARRLARRALARALARRRGARRVLSRRVRTRRVAWGRTRGAAAAR